MLICETVLKDQVVDSEKAELKQHGKNMVVLMSTLVQEKLQLTKCSFERGRLKRKRKLHPTTSIWARKLAFQAIYINLKSFKMVKNLFHRYW